MTDQHDGIDCDRCGRYIADTDADPIMIAWDDCTVCTRCHAQYLCGAEFDTPEPDDNCTGGYP